MDVVIRFRHIADALSRPRTIRPLPATWPMRGLTIRTALFVGFWLIFCIWAISGYSLVRRLGQVETRTAEIRSRFTRSEELLFTLRTNVLLGAVYLRDAVLDTGLREASYYHDRLNETRRNIADALQQYAPVLDSPGERENWRLLESEINAYWKMALPVLNWEAPKRAAEARNFLRREVIPKRDNIVRISERVQALNRAAFEQHQAELAGLYNQLRRHVWWTTGLSVLLGLAVAFLVTRYAGALEARIRQQHEQDLQNKSNLQRLSAQLLRAQEEERRTISRELHDGIGQALTAIKMDLSLAERNLGNPEKSAEPIQDARAIADRTLQAVRDLSQLLHPAMLHDLGLPDTLDWYVRGFSRRTGIHSELIRDRVEERMPAEVEVCVYRITQEGLTNVARHSKATTCRVYLQRLSHTLLVTIEDNGIGFEPEKLQPGEGRRGLGLLGIQERVATLGGIYRLESTPGHGTRISAELPVPALPSDQADVGIAAADVVEVSTTEPRA